MNWSSGLVQSLVRSELGKVELDAVQSDRGSLNVALLTALEDAGKTYGIRISRSEIIDVNLNATTQAAMAEVLAAERERRAAITRAEGERRATELNADAELYEAQRKADAIRAIAQANAESNRMLALSLGQRQRARGVDLPDRPDAGRSLGRGWRKSSNAKLIMLPGGPSNSFREGRRHPEGDVNPWTCSPCPDWSIWGLIAVILLVGEMLTTAYVALGFAVAAGLMGLDRLAGAGAARGGSGLYLGRAGSGDLAGAIALEHAAPQTPRHKRLRPARQPAAL